MASKIAADMSIGQVVELYPETLEIFEKYGLSCTGCLALFMDSIETGARRHEVDVDRLLAELNRLISQKTSSTESKTSSTGSKTSSTESQKGV